MGVAAVFANLLVCEEWELGENEIPISPDNASATLRTAITRLDGVQRTLVTLHGEDGESHMAVGGDASSGLVVYVTFDNDVFHQLVDPSAMEGDVEIVAGGQPGVYPRRYVVQPLVAIYAAETFATSGRLADGLEWTKT